MLRHAFEGNGRCSVREGQSCLRVEDIELKSLRGARCGGLLGGQALRAGSSATGWRCGCHRLVSVRANLHRIVCNGAACKRERRHHDHTSHARPPVVAPVASYSVSGAAVA